MNTKGEARTARKSETEAKAKRILIADNEQLREALQSLIHAYESETGAIWPSQMETLERARAALSAWPHDEAQP
jgi:hypothetical protein